jgi:hypothetical protein
MDRTAVKILCIGDVVGKPGVSIIADRLKQYIRDQQIDFVVCNAENAYNGSGITPPIFDKLRKAGVDVVTLGDHVYRRREVISSLETSDRIVRPANLAKTAPGRRWTVVPDKSGRYQIAVVCVLGQMYMGSNDSPWQALDDTFAQIPGQVRLRVVDFHAEATSEKIAVGWHLEGRATAVFGTHTHVPTADASILGGKTAHISDVGMTGPYDSVLGRRKDRVLSFLTSTVPTRFDVASGDLRICGCLVSADPSTGRALSIERVEIRGLRDGSDRSSATVPAGQQAVP